MCELSTRGKRPTTGNIRNHSHRSHSRRRIRHSGTLCSHNRDRRDSR